ncbi:MAG: metal ABC transporter substrate-binding protein [Thermodesulfobacteriota bacterium]
MTMLGRSLARLTPFLLLLTAALGLAPAWAGEGTTLRILCGTFPIYQFTRQVTQGRMGLEVELMIPPGLGCPHDYALTPQDMARIAKADVFVANGLGLEEFLGQPLRRANPKIKLIEASQGITDLIQTQEEGHKHGPNPHLFASPAQAARLVRNIAAGLGRIEPGGGVYYQRNAEAYAHRLEKLAEEFKAAGRTFKFRNIVTEHEVFDYLARDMGLTIVAVIEENPGREPSAAEMIGLVKRIKETGAAAVFTEPQYPAKVGRTIAREAGVPVHVLDPVASGPENAPLDHYEKVMTGNLAVLKKVLGGKSD